MPIRFVRIFTCLAAALALGASGVEAQSKLLRFPDISKDKVVFTYAGDLWTAPSAGGTASRLTAHPGLEMFAKFSPDGKWIAFTGQYDGDEQVYVVPAAGGVPKQLTYYPARGPLPPRWGYDNQVAGWTRDGKSVLFRSLRDGWDVSDSRLYTVPATGGVGDPLSMPISGMGDYSPDGKKVVYTPFARDFRTWKRYQGGWAQDLWIFDLASHDAKNVTSDPRTDRDPMWVAGRVYFNSDRTGTFNLYSYDVASGATAQLTKSAKWDVRWPSADDDGQIVYESNGELSVFDTRTGAERKIAVQVPTDGLYDRPSQVSAAEQVEDMSLSPKGERALFVARGDVFTAPIEKGLPRNLTRTSRSHEREARWSPDGRKVSYLSDATGEDELYLIDQAGAGKPEQLTRGGKAMRFAPEWAPDGKRIAFVDSEARLHVLTVADKKLVEIAHNTRGGLRDYAWSPCGGHLAFSLNDPSGFRSLYIWSVEDGKVRRITDEMFNERSPAWDPAGKYLYYVSSRGYAPQFDTLDFNFALDRNDGLYALALRKDVGHPFPPENDEVTFEDAVKEEKKDEKKDEKKEEKKGYTKIDFDGLADRVVRLPVPFDNYGGLAAAEGRLLFVRFPGQMLGREPVGQATLQVFTFKDRKTTPLVEGLNGWVLSTNGEKMLVAQGSEFNLYDANAGGKESKKTVSTAGLVVDRVPSEEWAEIFEEVWRRYRDFFYVENMHGYDWAAIREQYRPLLAHVGHRSDLNYVLGEMIAELNISHAYIAGGDFQAPERPQIALPGARFKLDEAAGRFKIEKIFAGENQEDRYRSPLTELGVDVKVGDYVLAIDGEELAGNDNPYRLLRHKAGRPFVRLTVNSKPTLEGSREVSFRPIDTETRLIYLGWVNGNREKVAKMSGGRVGYLHIPDMGEDGMQEFIKQYFGQIRKDGLIVDVRSNGGGFISQTLLERLGRKVLMVDFARGIDEAQPYPAQVFNGYMACLIDEGSGSDGDIFPAMFRELGLGPLIGKRTWGGVVGINGGPPLLDGGQVSVPQAGSASAKTGDWIIEGHGVDPDIEVENDPKSVLAGKDPQLERGVAEVMKKITEVPRSLPKRPAPPVKTQQ